MNRRLLVVDDDPAIVRLLRAIFVREGFEVLTAADGEAGLVEAAAGDPQIVIVDLELPGMDGTQVLERLKESNPGLPVVMLTGRDDAKTAVRAMRLGAADYVTKPFDPDEISLVVGRVLAARALVSEVQELRQRAGNGGLDVQMGPGAAVQRIVEQVRMVAATSFSVLILGETGTGKELVAAALHRESERRAKPFVALDCGAIPEALLESELFGHEKGAFTGAVARRLGRFELADGGTLFLDEVGDLPLDVQVKLLRVLQERELERVGGAETIKVDVRIVSATHRDLEKQIVDGTFREDLYYRLNVFPIMLPPLRDRTTDIPLLAEHFLQKYVSGAGKAVRGIDASAVAALCAYPWPGNVRELENVIERAVVLARSPEITVADLPAQFAPAKLRPGLQIPGATMDEIERYAITKTLESTGGSTGGAAKILNISVRKIQYKLHEYESAPKSASARSPVRDDGDDL